MNILIVTPELPWPPETGGKASQFATLKALQGDHSFRIVVSRALPQLDGIASQLERELPHVSVVRCPRPEQAPQASTLQRWRQVAKGLLRSLLNRGQDSGAGRPGEIIKPQRPYFPFVPLATESLALIEANLSWADLIQAEFHESLYLAFLPSGPIPKIFICHQAHGRFAQRFYCSQSLDQANNDAGDQGHHQSLMAATDTAAACAVEASWMAHFSRIITFTCEDQAALWDQDPSLPIQVSPFPIPADCAIVPPSEVGAWELELTYVGSGLWYPNVQAVEWFSHHVFPLLRKQLPVEACRLQVIGHWPEEMRGLLPPGVVSFHGYADRIADLLTGNISINPVFTGAGLRTKLLASAACNSPIVTTSIGCEGLGLADGHDCLIADNAEDFAAAILALRRDPAMASLLATRAFERTLQTFGPEAVRRTRNRIYAEVCQSFASAS